MPTDDIWFNAQINAFAAIRPYYEIFAARLRDLLQQAARSLGVSAIIQVRAKTIPSFAEKIQRKKDKYADPVHQLTDLCGARVITDTLDQTRRLCSFIRDHFDIDEANSLDVLERLTPAAFGYRSVHFVVSFKPGIFPDIPARLYETFDATAATEHAGLRGPKYKAEIQVRTLLQHAWATVAHDNIYKSPFPIPDRWSREAARIAALLEDADESFGRLLEAVTAYRSHFGAYMTQEHIRTEIANLQNVLAHDRDNPGLARRAARLALAVDDFQQAQGLLDPFRDTDDPLLVCDLAEAMIKSGEADAVAAGRDKLARLIETKPECERALELLAESHDDTNPAQALEHARQAFHAAPSEPRILRGFVERKLLRDRQTEFLPLLYPTLDKAIALSRERLALGVASPTTCRDIGMLELFREQPYAALEGFALAAILNHSESDLKDMARSLDDLKYAVGDRLRGLEWSRRFLALVLRARTRREAAGTTPAAPAGGRRDEPWTVGVGDLKSPVVIVAGGCDEKYEHRIAAYRDLFNQAFASYRGVIVCGGTTAGVSGLVGDLPGVARGDIRLVSHLPRHIPRNVTPHKRYETRDCDGEGFTPLGPIQGWVDILASGVDPAEVKVLGINGGRVSAAEFMIAATLGATVGLLRDSGREAHRLLGDPTWAKIPRILPLPSDANTLGEFLRRETTAAFATNDLETMARMVHENYRREQENKSVKTDPALVAWDALAENLKQSNRSVAAHDIFKLRAVGLDVERKDPDEIVLPTLSKEQLERMAELEHARWNMERLRDGWRLGPRDHKAKTSPYLVAWDELSDEIKQHDRDSVVGISARLKEIGYAVRPAAPDQG